MASSKRRKRVRVPVPARWAREATVWLAARCWRQMVQTADRGAGSPAAAAGEDRCRPTAVAMGRRDAAARQTLAASLPIFTHGMQTKARSACAAGGSHQQSVAHAKDVLPPPGSAENGTAAPRESPVGCRSGGRRAARRRRNGHRHRSNDPTVQARREPARRAAPRDRALDAAPAGTTIVSAWAMVQDRRRSSGGCRRWRTVALHRRRRTADWYQLSPTSGAARPKIARLRQTATAPS